VTKEKISPYTSRLLLKRAEYEKQRKEFILLLLLSFQILNLMKYIGIFSSLLYFVVPWRR